MERCSGHSATRLAVGRAHPAEPSPVEPNGRARPRLSDALIGDNLRQHPAANSAQCRDRPGRPHLGSASRSYRRQCAVCGALGPVSWLVTACQAVCRGVSLCVTAAWSVTIRQSSPADHQQLFLTPQGRTSAPALSSAPAWRRYDLHIAQAARPRVGRPSCLPSPDRTMTGRVICGTCCGEAGPLLAR